MANFSFHNITIAGMAAAVPVNKKAGMQPGLVRRQSPEEQTAGDLGYLAVKKILEEKQIDREQVGIIIFISKTPDYRSPATAMVLHNRLGLSKDCIAFDNNIGHAGFLYGMQIVCSLLQGLNKPLGLLVTGDTISKQFEANDHRAHNYGDAAAAILFEKSGTANPIFVQTNADGNERASFALAAGGFRKVAEDLNSEYLQIDEEKISGYVAAAIPASVKSFLAETKSSAQDFNVQAFPFAGENLLKELSVITGLLEQTTIGFMERYGDNCGSSIPMFLCDQLGKSDQFYKVLAGSFGEGFSWGVASFEVNDGAIFPVIESNEFFDNGFVTHEM